MRLTGLGWRRRDRRASDGRFLPVEEVFFPMSLSSTAIPSKWVCASSRLLPLQGQDQGHVAERQRQAGQLDCPKGKITSDEFFRRVECLLRRGGRPLTIARATPEAMSWISSSSTRAAPRRACATRHRRSSYRRSACGRNDHRSVELRPPAGEMVSEQNASPN